MGSRKFCSSFIKIRHGENEMDLFNPDCPMKLLVDNIRKKCNCPPLDLAVAEEVETSDETKITDVVELPENMENGRPYFSDRGSYVLLSILKREDRSEYECLLDEEHMSHALKDKILVLNNPKAAAERRPTRTSKVSKPPSRSNVMGSRGGRRATLAQTGLKGGKKINLLM